MPGPHQADNLRLALAAFHLLTVEQPSSVRQPAFPGLKEDPHVLACAARLAFIPGRFQVIPANNRLPELILDGAHNEPGLICLTQALVSLTIKPRAVIFACLKDKDLPAMLPLVRALTDGPITVPGLDVPGRAPDPAELAAQIGGDTLPVTNVTAALEKIRGLGESDGPVLVCGSLYLLAEVYKLRPDWLLGQRPR
jgi:dihydrofolate synthase/folylpolyglutamate synthase